MSKKVKTNQIPVFIGKIYDMVESKDNSEAVGWTSTNDSFSIKNVTIFTESVLLEYFKHRNFASFIRQLNMYGFKKIRHSQGQNVYMNENFKAGAKNLLKNITRKNKEDKEQQLQLYQNPHSGRHEPPLAKQMQDIRTNQKNLQEMSRYFMNQNQRLLDENQNFVRRLDQEERQKQEKLQEILIYLFTQRNTRTILNSTPQSAQLCIANGQVDLGNSVPAIKNEEANSLQPLDLIDKAISQNQEFSTVKNMIQDIYSPKQRKKQPSYKVQNHQIINKKGGLNDYIEPEHLNTEKNHVQHGVKVEQKDDRNLSSIYDCFNADQSPNLPFSNHD